ncbi:hypothetical protein N9E91_02225 [Alphaproteobacteria bacterium]|jgi:hypothetical protein|nr:hypothetical protein [Alphaproteobacteria bacterium]
MIPSLPKLLALAAIIWVVWKGFRLLERRNHSNNPPADSNNDPAQNNDGQKKEHRALDLEECRVCRAWVSGESCEREACPYRGQS